MLLKRCLLLGLTLSVCSRADWPLLHPRDATDSSSARHLYGIRVLRNAMSSATVRVAGGAVVLEASRIASDTAQPCFEAPCRLQGWSARVGVDHPLFTDGRIRDLTGLQTISFEFRNKEAITGYLGVGLGSSAVSESLDATGFQFEAHVGGAALLAAGTEWKKVEVDVTDFASPGWWQGGMESPPSYDSVLAYARSLRFIPYSGYQDSGALGQQACARCAVPTMSSPSLEIRNIVLKGAEKYPDPPIGDCSGDVTVLDNLFDDHENEWGGNWFRYMDSDSTDFWGRPNAPSQRGRSVAWDSLARGDEFTPGAIRLNATLTPPGAGADSADVAWAAIGTGTCFSGRSRAIAFHLIADSMPASVEGVRMVLLASGDSISMMIPSRLFARSGGASFCYTPDSGEGITHLDAIVWEVRTSDLPVKVSFSVGDVRFYDLWELLPLGARAYERLGCSYPGAVRRLAALEGASVSWSAGALSLRGATDASVARVVGLDGRQVATFAPAACVPLCLSRGTWILELQRRSGRVERLPFVVLGR